MSSWLVGMSRGIAAKCREHLINELKTPCLKQTELNCEDVTDVYEAVDMLTIMEASREVKRNVSEIINNLTGCGGEDDGRMMSCGDARCESKLTADENIEREVECCDDMNVKDSRTPREVSKRSSMVAEYSGSLRSLLNEVEESHTEIEAGSLKLNDNRSQPRASFVSIAESFHTASSVSTKSFQVKSAESSKTAQSSSAQHFQVKSSAKFHLESSIERDLEAELHSSSSGLKTSSVTVPTASTVRSSSKNLSLIPEISNKANDDEDNKIPSDNGKDQVPHKSRKVPTCVLKTHLPSTTSCASLRQASAFICPLDVFHKTMRARRDRFHTGDSDDDDTTTRYDALSSDCSDFNPNEVVKHVFNFNNE